MARTDQQEGNMKKGRTSKAEGTIERAVGRVMDAIGGITGRPKTKGKGKAARARGSAKSARGRVRRAAR
jgi:uncharacterized protein YjbJ (UPF0337 family)